MNLRPYQSECLESIREALKEHQSTLCVMPTGCGKTVVFAHAAKERAPLGRVMVIAHRQELIAQAAGKLEAIMGEAPDIEMADFHADTQMFRKARVVVASKDSLTQKRLKKFNPADFVTIITDEAHHAVATSYRKIYDYFAANPAMKHIGVTATPDRTDERALGQIYASVAYDYEILDAIKDGWLVDIVSECVQVHDLDFSGIDTVAGDLNQRQLAEVMEAERTCHEIASTTLQIAGGRKTLVFSASRKHAEMLVSIFNRHKPDSARWVSGETPREDRAAILADYAKGKLQFLVNVGVFTEGFDDPTIQIVAIARPTKSRSLYAQMVGRGTRPLPGIVDGPETAELRRSAIAASAKPHVTVIDFEGNAGQHKLVSPVDILGGKKSDVVMAKAKKIVEKFGGKASSAIAEAEEQIRKEMAKAARKAIVGKAKYTTRLINPFDVFDIELSPVREWDRSRQPSEKQVALLQSFGIDASGLTMAQAGQMIGECMDRRRSGLCTIKQIKKLREFGYDSSMTFTEAKNLLSAIEANGWRRPKPPTRTAPGVPA